MDVTIPCNKGTIPFDKLALPGVSRRHLRQRQFDALFLCNAARLVEYPAGMREPLLITLQQSFQMKGYALGIRLSYNFV